VWMYEVGGRKLGYLHPMETGLSGTFILTETEERELAVTDGLPRPSRHAIRDGRMASGVRWCWMEFPDLDTVDAFVHIIELKHQLLHDRNDRSGRGAACCAPYTSRPCVRFRAGATFRRPQSVSQHRLIPFAI